MNLRDTYNKIARVWHKDHQEDDWWTAGTRVFMSFLKPGSLVLDVGCGGGVKTAHLTKNGFKVIGIDFAEEMVAIAQKEVPDAEFRVLDMREADALPETFDGIFAQASLLHIPKTDVPTVVHTLSIKLKHGGYFYIAVKGIRPDGPEEEIKKENDYGYPYERFFSYFTQEEIESYFKTSGLEIVFSEIYPTGKSDWIQVIGKK